MRLRSRMVGDAEDDGSAVASASSSSMDDQSSTEAVLGSPATRRSLSTHDSQNPPPSPTPVTSSSAHPNPHDPQAYQFHPQPSRGEQNTYLTDYETAALAEHSDYPTEISDSQDLYSHFPAQTHSPENQNIYVQPPPPLTPQPQAYNALGMYSNPQTPTQLQAHQFEYQGSPMSPTSQPPLQNHFPNYDNVGYDNTYSTPQSQPPTQPHSHAQYPSYRPNFYTPHTQPPSRTAEYQQSTPAPLFTQLSPYQPNQPFQPNPYTQIPHLQTPTSVPLDRFVAPNPEESWSPIAQPNPESHKQRILEADSTVGFSHNKMRTELDEMEGGQGSQQPAKKKRRRWTRGKPRGRGGSRDRGNGKGRDKRGRGGHGGAGRGDVMA